MTMPTGYHYDMTGVTEDNTIIYTLVVYKPRRPSPPWMPSFITRTPVKSPKGGRYRLPSSNHDPKNPKYCGFLISDLADMQAATVTIQSGYFHAEYRCEHVQGGEKTCPGGCYVLEKGEDPDQKTISHWCDRKDCQGHAYCGRIIGKGKVECFGKPGQRLVALDRS